MDRQPAGPLPRRRNLQEQAGTMAKFVLIALGAVVVIAICGAGFLMVWDIPAPSERVERVIPDAKLPK
jgi:small neutral amino acid transporter SnatA (MarC family)